MRKINKTRHSLKPFFLFLLGLVIIIFVLKGLALFLYTNSTFKITQLQVSGNYPLDNSIKESIWNMNIFRINLKELSHMIIAKHPEILKAEVRRFLPDKVAIELKHRLVFARIEPQGYFHKTLFVDKEGFILKKSDSTSFNALPKITGINTELARIREGRQAESIQLTKALSLLREIVAFGDRVDYEVTRIDVTSYKNLSFFIDSGIEVRIGAGNFKERISLLNRTLSELEPDDYQPKYIDLRFGDPIIGTR